MYDVIMFKKVIFKLMKIMQRFCMHFMNISNLCKLIAMLGRAPLRSPKMLLHGMDFQIYSYLPFTQKTYSFYFMLDYNLWFSIGCFA